MKSIEERAKEYASKMGDISLSPVYNKALASVYKEGYIAGANEQKAIDIERACEWLKNNLREYGIILFGHWESDFRKVMEEQL